MVRALASQYRGWRLRRLRLRACYLEEKLELYRRYPHNLGFEGLERVAAEERKLRRVLFTIGLIELRERLSSPNSPPVRVV